MPSHFDDTTLGPGPTGRPLEILYVAYRLPFPPDKGERIRTFHQIRFLAEHARVHLVCPLSGAERREHIEALRVMCASIRMVRSRGIERRARELYGLLSGESRMAATFASGRLARAVRGVLRDFTIDVVLASTLHVAKAVHRVPAPAKAIDLIDAYSDLWSSMARLRGGLLAWLSRVEGDRLARYESRLLQEFDRTIVVSEPEAELLRGRLGEARAGYGQLAEGRISVVGNGVDLDYFRPSAAPPEAGSPSVAFVGTMDYFPNVDAVRYFHSAIWPRVIAAVPGARFVVVGRNPPRSIRALSSDPSVRITGAVADVRPYLARATAAIAPFRIARGIQNKILEALAMGVPVVATSAARAGLDPEGRDVVVGADEPERFAAELVTLLEDPARRQDLARRGRAYVEARHRWDDHGARLLAVLHQTIAGRD